MSSKFRSVLWLLEQPAVQNSESHLTITGTDKLSSESTKCTETTRCFKEHGAKGKVEDVLITSQYLLLVGKESNKMRLYNRHLCTEMLLTGDNAWQLHSLVHFSMFYQLHGSCGAHSKGHIFTAFLDYFCFHLTHTEHSNRIYDIRHVGYLLGFGR
jgi:hypothetical protein